MSANKRDLLEKALKMFEACYGEKDHPHRGIAPCMSLGNAYGALGDVPQTRGIFSRRP